MLMSFLLWMFAFHPVHLSIAELKPQQKEMVGTLKVFIDDWESVVGSTETQVNFKQKSQEYINQHWYVMKGKKRIFPKLTSWQQINYQQGKWVVTFPVLEKEITHMHNDVLLDRFEDQQNMVHWGKRSFGFYGNDWDIELK